MIKPVGLKIKKIRELKNLTQDYMAQRLEMSQSNYSKIESGETDVPFKRLEFIAGILGFKVEDLISFDEQYVFNVMHNQTGNGLVVNNLSSEERKMYEEQITFLKGEIDYLKTLLSKVFPS